MRSTLASSALVVLGAAVGGVLGYAGFWWFLGFGYYALVLPGGLLGVGAGLPRNRWVGWAFLGGAAALALGVFTEWRASPMKADPGLGYLLTHFHEVRPPDLLMIAVGTAIGFYGPFSAYRRATRGTTPAARRGD